MTYRFIQGNEACALGALKAGCNFFAGYPITPSSEIMNKIIALFKEKGGNRKFLQMEDEISSISALIGAAWSGAKGMTATSGPGFSLMLEGLSYAIMTETPLVIIDIQRAGPSTGQATKTSAHDVMQARYGAHGDYQLIVLSPSSVEEMYAFTFKAFELSEKFRVPVILLADETTAHIREKVFLSKIKLNKIPQRSLKKIEFPFGIPGNDSSISPMGTFGQGSALSITGSTHNEKGIRLTQDKNTQHSLITRLNKKITSNISEISSYSYKKQRGAEYLIICYGFTARPAKAALSILADKGIKLDFLKINTLWPLDKKLIQRVTRNKKGVIFPEMNTGLYANMISGFSKCPIRKVTKIDGTPFTPAEIYSRIDKLTR